MRIGLYHGYALTGSGSNEYTRYLAKSLVEAGHEVHLICREDRPESIPYVTHGRVWSTEGTVTSLFDRSAGAAACYLHQLPHGPIRPVYLTDKQRKGCVKTFVSLSEEELESYHRLNEALLTKILSTHRLDILHCNHLVGQPATALRACQTTQTAMIIYPHGSSIEYTLKADSRYQHRALRAVLGATGLIIGNQEVLDRILDLYPQHRQAILAKSRIVGVGVDTSLFKPVDRANRRDSIQRLIETAGGGGKHPGLSERLRQRLMNGDIQATRDDWDTYDHALPDADLNQKLVQIPWDKQILLFVGALTVGKGVQSVITALPWIIDQHPDTHLVIVGAGAYREVLEAWVEAISRSDRSLLLELCTAGQDLDRNDLAGPWLDVQHWLDQPANLSFLMAHGAGIGRHVHFLGRLDHARLRYLFPCSDLAMFPSVVPEAYPLVVMEALSNGVLPVVSYFSGFTEAVDQLQSFLAESIIQKAKIPVEPESRIGRIVSHVNDLLGQSNLDDLRVKLRQIAVDHYDWKIRASQMVDAYRWVIQRAISAG